MAKHREIEKLIQKKLDREASVEELSILSEHLAMCSDCRELDQQLGSVEQGIISLTEYFPRHDFNARVLAKLGFAKKAPAKKALAWSKITAVLTIAWLTGLGVFLLSPLSKAIFSRILLLTPTLVHIYEKAAICATGIREVFVPFLKASFNPVLPIAGVSMAIVTVYLFAKLINIKREETCKA